MNCKYPLLEKKKKVPDLKRTIKHKGKQSFVDERDKWEDAVQSYSLKYWDGGITQLLS